MIFDFFSALSPNYFQSYLPLVNKCRLLLNMAPHSSELTLEQKEIITQLSNEGYSSQKKQDLIRINARTIQISETCTGKRNHRKRIAKWKEKKARDDGSKRKNKQKTDYERCDKQMQNKNWVCCFLQNRKNEIKPRRI